MLELINYEPSLEGGLTWKHSRGSQKAESPCGYKRKTGYWYTEHNRKAFANHDLIWRLNHGEIPKGYCVDHIDGNPSNNKLDNLRLASKSDNSCNKRMPPNSSGYKGISWNERHKAYSVRVTKDKKVHFAGWFKDLDKAVIAVRELREKLHGNFTAH